MKNIRRTRIKLICGNQENFEIHVNEALEELEGKDVQITEVKNSLETLRCLITYEEHLIIPETIKDEFALAGKKNKCIACEYFSQTDRRKKTGLCLLHQEITYKLADCCDEYYMEFGNLEEESEER